MMGSNTRENFFSLVESEMGIPGQCIALLQVVTQGSTFLLPHFAAMWIHCRREVKNLDTCTMNFMPRPESNIPHFY